MYLIFINATTGPEGFFPMLLLFVATPRPAQGTPSATKIQLSMEKESALVVPEKKMENRRISFSLRQTRGPKGGEDPHVLEYYQQGYWY